MCRNLNLISFWFETCGVTHNSSQVHLQLSGTSIFPTGRDTHVAGLLSEEGAEGVHRGARAVCIFIYTCTWARTLPISTALWPPGPLPAKVTKINQNLCIRPFALTLVQVQSQEQRTSLCFPSTGISGPGASWLLAWTWECDVPLCRWESWARAWALGLPGPLGGLNSTEPSDSFQTPCPHSWCTAQ